MLFSTFRLERALASQIGPPHNSELHLAKTSLFSYSGEVNNNRRTLYPYFPVVTDIYIFKLSRSDWPDYVQILQKWLTTEHILTILQWWPHSLEGLPKGCMFVECIAVVRKNFKPSAEKPFGSWCTFLFKILALMALFTAVQFLFSQKSKNEA